MPTGSVVSRFSGKVRSHGPAPTSAPRHPGSAYRRLAGTQPAGLYRSDDAGKSWRNLDVPMKPYALTGYYQGDNPFPDGHPAAYGRKHWTRVTQIVFDAADSSLVWAGVEIDGAWRSIDGGKRWERSDQGMKSQDIHGFAVYTMVSAFFSQPRTLACMSAATTGRAGRCARSIRRGNTLAPSSSARTGQASCS